jgi:hypothetical protein
MLCRRKPSLSETPTLVLNEERYEWESNLESQLSQNNGIICLKLNATSQRKAK